MKNIIISLVAVAFFGLASSALAQGKIATYSLEGAILSTEKAKQRAAEYEKNANFAQLKAQYEAVESELQALNEKREKEGATWSPEQIAEHRKQMEYKRADGQLVIKKLQAEEQQLRNGILQEMAADAQKIAQEIIQAEGIGLVINAQAVMFADSYYNITPKITDRLNKLAQ